MLAKNYRFDMAMDLFDAAVAFDTCPVADAYTGLHLFYGQMQAFEESNPEGSLAKKRSMSVGPTINPPPRGAIIFMGEVWLVGDGLVDEWRGRPIRKNYWIKKSAGLATIRSPLQAILATGGVQAHTSQTYMKSTVEPMTDSDYTPFFEFFFTLSETIHKGYFIELGGQLYRAREAHIEQAGYINAPSDQLVNTSATTINVESSTYDPITDRSTGSIVSVPALILDVGRFYVYSSGDAPTVERADKLTYTQSFLLVGKEVTVGTIKYLVKSSTPELDAYVSLLRPL